MLRHLLPFLAVLPIAFPFSAHAQEGMPWVFGGDGDLYFGTCEPRPEDGYSAQQCASYSITCLGGAFELAVPVSDLSAEKEESPDGRLMMYDLMNGDYEGYEDFGALVIAQPQNLQSPLYIETVELSSPGGDSPMLILLRSRDFGAFDALRSISGVEEATFRLGRTELRLFSTDSERQSVESFMKDCAEVEDDPP